MKELETIAAWFEGSQVNLDEGLAKFERGMELAGQLRQHLEEIGNRVEKVKARFDVPSMTAAEASVNELDQPEPIDAAPPANDNPELF